jgi:hypothetical protein
MPFALTSIQLEGALKKAGCPICRLSEEAVQKTADGFLYENTMNPDWRKPIMEAHGFCPTHTKLMVAIEMSSSGPVLGINYIYEALARQVADELDETQSAWKKLSARLSKVGKPKDPAPCPLCEFQTQTETNLLDGLFEELNTEGSAFRDAYTQSDGLCYAHLMQGVFLFAKTYPEALNFIVPLTQERLRTRSAEMKEYIRKHDWHYREEPKTEAEQSAWKRTLTFFTGLPDEMFNHKVEKR